MNSTSSFNKIPKMDFSKCPQCGSPTERCESISGSTSKFWLRCPHCNTYIDTYIPQPHQAQLHADPTRYKGNFGGYGSGKTLTDQKEVAKHIFLTDSGNTLVGANISSQYEQTVKREMEADLPKEFVIKTSVKDQYHDFKNGHRLMFRPFDDPGKLRSLNLSMFLIIEGSETDLEVYTQLKTRLRNDSAIIYELDEEGNRAILRSADGEPVLNQNGHEQFIIKHDWRSGLVESNPDSGYIRSHILLPSSKIHQFGFDETYDVEGIFRDPMTASYVTATLFNRYLPHDYMDSFNDKPDWWRKRYLFGSFQYAEGLVYPEYSDIIVDDFDIPSNWLRMIAFDYGLSDDAAFIFAAIDPEAGVVYIYKELTTNNVDIDALSELYFRGKKDIPDGGMAYPPIIDPKSGPKRDYNKKSLIDHFLERGIYFEPGTVSVETRVMQTNSYIRAGKIKIFKGCSELIGELREYKFPEKTLDSSPKNANKPMDKNNHRINPMEWIITRLPMDPGRILQGLYNREGTSFDEYTDSASNNAMPWQLSGDIMSQDDPFQVPSFGIFDLDDL